MPFESNEATKISVFPEWGRIGFPQLFELVPYLVDGLRRDADILRYLAVRYLSVVYDLPQDFLVIFGQLWRFRVCFLQFG